MNPTEEKEILSRASVDDSLFAKKNVQSYYPGTKTSNGVDTGEPCLVIGVTKKVDSVSLLKKDLIPLVLGDNIKTDVIEEPEISRYGACGSRGHLGVGNAPSGPCEGHAFNDQGDPYKNAQGGISIGPSGASRAWSGTLSLIVRDKSNGKLVGLSNNHVLGDYVDDNYESLGCFVDSNGNLFEENKVNEFMEPLVENFIQTPSVNDSEGNSILLGRVKRCVPTIWGTASNIYSLPYNVIDAGIFELGEQVQPMTDLAHLIRDKITIAEAQTGKRVSKSGRTTGVTGVSETTASPTEIISSNYTVMVGSGCGDGLRAKFTDCIKFDWNPSQNNMWEWFSYAGDSGSAIMMEEGGERKLVGLLFAGTHFQSSQNVPNPPFGTGIACKIQNVLSGLNLEIWDGNVICGTESEFVKVNGQCYQNTSSQRPVTDISHTEHEDYNSLEECAQN